MKASVQAGALARAAAAVASIARSTYDGALLRSQGGRLTLASIGGDLGIEITLEALVEEEGQIIIRSTLMQQLASALPSACNLLLSSVGEALITISPHGRHQFRAMGGEGWATPEPVDPIADFVAPLGEMLDWCQGAALATNEPAATYLSGVHLQARNGKLVAEACDRKRLLQRVIELPLGASELSGVIVPRPAIALIARHLPNDCRTLVNRDESVLFVEGEGEGVRAWTKLIDGGFPNLQRVLADLPEPGANIIIDRAVMLAALTRLRPVLDGKKGELMATLEGCNLKLMSKNEHGEAEERVEIERGGDDTSPMSARYRASDLELGLRSMGPIVDMDMRRDGSICRMRDPADAERLFAFMSMIESSAVWGN